MTLGKKIQKEFPIFKHNPKLTYLDSASSTQTCADALQAMDHYYTKARANVHRGIYELSGRADKLYEDSRDVIAEFIGANDTEIIFTSGVTHGLNLLAYVLSEDLKKGDNIVLTRLEHHANLIPWQQMSKKYGFEIRFIEFSTDFKLQITDLPIDNNTKIVSFAHISNAIGVIAPVKKIIAKVKEVGALTIIDAAQSIAHKKIDVRDLGCDFLVFSGHKAYGPTGIGVLWGKNEHLKKIRPFFYGGDMIKEVTYENATWNDLPWKFEAGTPNIAGVIGLGAAVRFIERVGIRNIEQHDAEITQYCISELANIGGVTHIGPKDSGPVVSFTIDGIHPHDVASLLDREGVAVRAGHHCTMPLMKHLGLHGTVRASFGIYNTKDDVDALVKGVKHVIEKFSV